MKFFSLLFGFFLPFSLLAAPAPSRRLADLQEGSEFLVQLNDPELLEKREREWRKGSEFDGTRCDIGIHSHFDRAQAEASGETKYVVTQVHNQNSFSAEGQIRDQATFWLSTANKDLPLLSLDCFRMTMIRWAPDRALTLASVSTLLGMPRLFQKPIYSEIPSELAADSSPRIRSIATLVPLHFAAVETGPNSLSITAPIFQNGKVIEKLEPGSSCRAGIGGGRKYEKAYDMILPVGSKFIFEYISTNHFENSEMLSFRGYDSATFTYFEISCYSREKFHGFAEVANHLKGLLTLE